MTPSRIAACLVAALSSYANADDLAHPHTQHAAVCHLAGTAHKDLQYTDNGIVGLSSRGVEVICPIDRNYPVGSGSFIMWVYGNVNGSALSCSLSSYSYQGQFLGTTGFNLSGGTYFQEQMALTGSQVPDDSLQELHCKLGRGAMLFGFEPLL